MKMKHFLILVLVILTLGAYFFPVTQQVDIIINTSVFNVYNQLNNADSWKKWEADLKDANTINEPGDKKGFKISTSSTIIKVSLLDALAFGIKKGDVNYVVVLDPQKYDRTTKINVIFGTNLLCSLLPGQTDKWLKRSSIADLKNYIENPSSYYGADFKKTELKGMNMMVTQTVVSPADQFTAMAKSVEKLRNLIPADLTVKDKIYVQTTPSNSGTRVNLLVGVHVKKPLPSSSELTYMHIPTGKALVVDYKGIYQDRLKIYDGIGTYLQDHLMNNTMQPIEVYQDNALPLNDTSRVNSQIIFRVF
jgi:hypothetical protein